MYQAHPRPEHPGDSLSSARATGFNTPTRNVLLSTSSNNDSNLFIQVGLLVRKFLITVESDLTS